MTILTLFSCFFFFNSDVISFKTFDKQNNFHGNRLLGSNEQDKDQDAVQEQNIIHNLASSVLSSHGFILILSKSGEMIYISDSVMKYLGK